MRVPIISALLIFIATHGYSQEKKAIHFLLDTINVTPQNRIFKIETAGSLSTVTFYCSCLGQRKEDIVLMSFIRESNKIILSKKPEVNFVSWRDLLKTIMENPEKFNALYDIYMTVALPNNKYRTFKAGFGMPHQPTD